MLRISKCFFNPLYHSIMKNLLLNQLLEFVLIHCIAFIGGILVMRYRWKVNYTRKINHFFVFFAPYAIKLIFPFQETLLTQVIIALVGLATLSIYILPIRQNLKIVSTMVAAFDRPEDRPYTLKWLFTQYLATYVVAIPLWIIFDKMHHQEAIVIIILINAIGDGLAEPIGITWGKNKYQVKALFTSNIYTRSIQGSACVFITSLIVLCLFSNYFSLAQFLVSLFAVPTVATLAEAKSPHTWDSPFIFVFTGVTLLLIYLI
jgi:dolichol kinase